MRRLFKLMVLTFFVAAVFTSAYADSVTATVLVWNEPLPGQAQATIAAVPGGAPTWQFNYTGPINFVLNGGANTFQNFFGSNAAGITPFSGESTFLASTMSVPGAGNLQTYMAFLFQLNVPAVGFSGTVFHDDGASLYNCGASLFCNSTITPIFESPAWTSDLGNAFTLPGGTNDYALVYVEGNGAPSILQMPVPSAVPEPASLFLLGSGMLTLAGIGRRFVR